MVMKRLVKRTQFIEASTFSKAGILRCLPRAGTHSFRAKPIQGIRNLFFHKMHGLPNYPHQTTPRNKGLLRLN